MMSLDSPVDLSVDPTRGRRFEHLLVLPVGFRVVEGRFLWEEQARHGLLRWLDSFEDLLVAVPRTPESRAGRIAAHRWVPVDDLGPRVRFVPLPADEGPAGFLRQYAATAEKLRRCIDASRYIQCAIGGGNGGLENDWAAVAAEEAIRAGRRYALHVDGVNFQEIRRRAEAHAGPTRRLGLRLKARLVESWQARLARHCDLLLCHGMDAYLGYAPLCRDPEIPRLVHNVHLPADALMTPDAVERKCAAAARREGLHVVYAGRVEPQKAPLQWIRAIGHARALGADIRAAWLGEGSMLADMRRAVAGTPLEGSIELPGFVDHDRVIDRLRGADLMAFAHLDAESPRCLIEALMSACPIVGYDSAYARELVSRHGGGIFGAVGDWRALGESLAALAADRPRVVDLIRRAAGDGRRFDSATVFRERSELIRTHLA